MDIAKLLSELFITLSITAALKGNFTGDGEYKTDVSSEKFLYFWGHRNHRLPV